MQVLEIDNKANEREFLSFGKTLYKNDPEYIMPLYKDIQDVFDPKINLYFSKGNACRWLLRSENGNTLGRIAAFYIDKKDGRWGGVGFFECENNQSCANALFNAAKGWLQEQGCTYMDGLVNFGERDKYWGVLVKGFKDPSYQENYHPPYYQNLIEQFGFLKTFEQTTSELGLGDLKLDRFIRLSERVFSNPDYHFEHFRMTEVTRFAKDFIEIYNQAWAARPDFNPITQEAFESTLHSLKPILIEEAVWFVYAKGKPAGFYVSVLDVNQIFKKLNGKLNFWGKIKFLYYRRFGKLDRIRGIVFGIIPSCQNLGLEAGMIMKTFQAMRAKHPEIVRTELSWIGDFNPKMHSLFEALGARTTKIHYTYRYSF
jgi:hypothetical protein